MTQKPYTTVALIKRIAPFIRPYVPKYLLAMSLLLVTSVLSLLPPILLKLLIDRGIQARNLRAIDLVCIALVGVFAVSAVTRWLMEYIHEWVSAWFITSLRGYLFAHLLTQPISFFSSRKTGDILGRLRTDIAAVYGVLVNTFLGCLSEVIQIVGIAAFLFYLNAKLALMAIAFAPPLYLFLLFFGRVLRRVNLKVRDKDVGLLEFFQERITNISAVKLYHRESFEQASHDGLSQGLNFSILESVRWKFISVFVISMVATVPGILVIWSGGYRVINGTLSFGTLFAFYLYTTRLFQPIQSLANRGVDIYKGLASTERIVEYLDRRSEIVPGDVQLSPSEVRGEIAFQDVEFCYPDGDGVPVIRRFNLDVGAGQKIALVGTSGAGKSTLMSLLGRLYDVDRGSISVDGHDIRKLTFDSLYGSIGYLSQDAPLFNTTIEENIRYGKLDASHEEIVLAAQKANLAEFVRELPRGYQTVIGPRGMKLSGGQRQRLGLARLILKNAPIWILDEFTSSLDSASESVVYENILPLVRGKTTVIIAHRLSTILAADVIVVLHDGKIVEQGSHQELCGRNGFYKMLFERQFGGESYGIENHLDALDHVDRAG